MSDEQTATVPDDWPKCPECEAPRSTRCPVCGTAGTDFQQADMGFTLMSGRGEAATAACPGCAPGVCGAGDVPSDAKADVIDEEDESPVLLLMCHTCDEPFQPEYPRVCEWCGHEFPDGFEMEMPTDPVEQFDARVIAVIVGLLVLFVALVGYFMFIV